MVNESRFVAVKHAVQTQGEELTSITELNRLLARFVVERIVHVEQKAKTAVIVVATPHIALLFGYNFSSVLANK